MQNKLQHYSFYMVVENISYHIHVFNKDLKCASVAYELDFILTKQLELKRMDKYING